MEGLDWGRKLPLTRIFLARVEATVGKHAQRNGLAAVGWSASQLAREFVYKWLLSFVDPERRKR
jgi:hypothetical protein